ADLGYPVFQLSAVGSELSLGHALCRCADIPARDRRVAALLAHGACGAGLRTCLADRDGPRVVSAGVRLVQSPSAPRAGQAAHVPADWLLQRVPAGRLWSPSTVRRWDARGVTDRASVAAPLRRRTCRRRGPDADRQDRPAGLSRPADRLRSGGGPG